MTISIRTMLDRDERAWRHLFQGYIAFYRAAVPAHVVDSTFSRLLDGTFLGLLAVDQDDAPVGLAHALFHPSTWSKEGYCYLEDLFVDPACRGQGAGRALIEAVYREADKRGCLRTYWTTGEDNNIARRLYNGLAVKAPFVQYRRG